MTGSGPFARGGKGHPTPPSPEPASPAAPPDPGPGGPVPVNDDQPAAPPCGQALPGRQADGRRSRPAAAGVRFVRRSSRDEIIARLKQRQQEQEAYRIGLIKIRERGLLMKLTRVEQSPDGARLVFYFTAEGRIDFRELVRELAAEFRSRIEMRQIGVRDEARMLGGYGSCGRPLCCAMWLQGFEPVSIKMAKQQDLSLNPWKLSGVCGRLKCCLRYELAGGKNGCPNGSREPDEEVEEQAPLVPDE